MDFRPLRWVTVILATMAGPLEAQVSMSPSGTASHPKIRWANATGNTVTFDITNLSSTNDYRYTRTCTGTGNVTITTCPTVGLIAFGTTRTVTATFSVGAAGTGSVQLSITESPLTPGGGSDSGTWTITTVTPTATVSPNGTTVQVAPSSPALTQAFTIANTSRAAGTFSLAAVCTGTGCRGAL